MEKCAAIGPRGGLCRRQADQTGQTDPSCKRTVFARNPFAMFSAVAFDFCKAHNQMVRDGQVIWCRKCGGPAGEPPPTEPECPWCGKPCPDARKPQGCWYMDCPDEPHAN